MRCTRCHRRLRAGAIVIGPPDPGGQPRFYGPGCAAIVLSDHPELVGSLAGRALIEPLVRFTCPRCGMTSYHPSDVAEGYCGACHDWTGTPARTAHVPAVSGPCLAPDP